MAGEPKTRHCYNGTPSTAAALAILGQADDADFDQTWHLPFIYRWIAVMLLERSVARKCQ